MGIKRCIIARKPPMFGNRAEENCARPMGRGCASRARRCYNIGSGYRPLGVASFLCRFRADRIETVDWLLEAGADANGLDGFGRSALMTAAALDLKDVIALLLSKGDRAGLRNDAGESALMLAAEAGGQESALLILEADPPVSGSTWSKLERMARAWGMKKLGGVVASRKDARAIREAAKTPRKLKNVAGAARL